eukprot:9482066-Lingulodinium_polyedra.AAC.1
MAWRDMAWHGARVRMAWRGVAWRGVAKCGVAWPVRVGLAWRERTAKRGTACRHTENLQLSSN